MVAQIRASVLTRRSVTLETIDGIPNKIHQTENTDENLKEQFRQ